LPSSEPTNPEPSHRFRPRRSPPWWPEGEPWPPARRPSIGHWRRARGRFLRRVGCGIGLLFLFASGTLTALLWLVVSAAGLLNLSESTLTIVRMAGIGLLGISLASVFFGIRTFRRTALPFGDFVEAVGRITDGDYSVRMADSGPGDLQRLAQQFNSMAERLQINDEQRRNLLAEVTHELRTPITVIQGNLEGILDGIYPADPERIETILEEIRVLSRLIDDLRTLSLAESGGLKLEVEPTEIGDLIKDVLGSFQAQANQAKVNLAMDIEQGLPLVEVDPTRIREVIANLLSNALRYTPVGGKVTLGADLPEDHSSALRIIVQDTGSGISPDDLPFIFDRFYKSGESHGTGLGLAIARSLVAAHGGDIQAESQEEAGTKIMIYLPIEVD
jgi:signal transduction histidine kinase